MKVGDLVKHKHFGYGIGIITNVCDRMYLVRWSGFNGSHYSYNLDAVKKTLK